MTAITDENWLTIPAKIRSGYIKHAGTVQQLLKLYPDDAYWVIHDESLGDLHIKNAGFLATPNNYYMGAQKLIGGPNPITSSLLSAALGAGLGYGGGVLMENLFPEQYMDKGKGRLRKNLALMGGLAAGAIPALTWGLPAYANHGWKGLVNGWPYRPQDMNPADQNKRLARPWAKEDWKPDPNTNVPQMPHGADPTKGIKASPGVPAEQDILRGNQDFNLKKSAEEIKQAFNNAITGAGGAFVPRVRRDAFNRAVLDDPFMDNRLKGQTMGLASAASMSRGSGMFAPVDVARVGGSILGRGIMGAAMGLVAGKVMSAFMGITPAAQKKVRDAGVMAGIMSAVVPRVYGQ